MSQAEVENPCETTLKVFNEEKNDTNNLQVDINDHTNQCFPDSNETKSIEEIQLSEKQRKEETEGIRNIKKQAMNRMRSSIKDTLFKGISKKVNSEGGNQAVEQPKQRETSRVDQVDEKDNEDEIRDTNTQQRQQLKIGNENTKHVESNQISKQKPDSLWNVIIEEKEQTSTSSNQSSIINETRIFEENYEILGQKLGEGCHGDVRKCRHKLTNKIYAVKMIRNGDTEIILSAISSFQIAKNLSHPSIIKPKELFINRETEKISYVMEFCNYGSLQEHVEHIWSFSPRRREKYKNREPSIEFCEVDEDLEQSPEKIVKKKVKHPPHSLLKHSGSDHYKSNSKKNKKKLTNEEDKIFSYNQEDDKEEENKFSFQNDEKEEQWETQNEDEEEESKRKSIDNSSKRNESGEDEYVDDVFQIKLQDDFKSEVDLIQPEQKKSLFHHEQNMTSSKFDQKVESSKQILQQILIAVNYLHQQGICHRDLKPDNILVSKDLQNVKIIDFEISKQFKFFRTNRTVLKTCEMWTRTGTQDFMSPEMFESAGYTEAVDMWAVGVIAYVLLTGRLPFDQEYISDKIEFIRNGSYNTEYLKDVDEVPKDFIRRMLKKVPSERLTAEEALSHPWFLVNGETEFRVRKEFSLSKTVILNYKSLHSNNFDSKHVSEKTLQGQGLHLIKGNQSTIVLKNERLFGNKSDKQRKDANQVPFQPLHLFEQASCRFSYQPKSVESSTTLRSEQYQERYTDASNETKRNKQINIAFYQQSSEDLDSELAKIPQNMKLDQTNSTDIVYIHGLDSKENSNEGKGTENKQEDGQRNIYKKAILEAKQKEEFQQMIQNFKKQMEIGSGMADLFQTKFIHINQKKKSHPQVSQLRLKLLQQKKEKESHQLPQTPSTISQSSISLLQQSVTHLQQSVLASQLLASDCTPQSGSQQQKQQYLSFAEKQSQFAQISSEMSSSIIPTIVIDETNDNQTKSLEEEASAFQFTQQSSTNFLQVQNASQLRSRSNSNNFNEIYDFGEQKERRAKKWSEDFTSSCVVTQSVMQEGSADSLTNQTPLTPQHFKIITKINKCPQLNIFKNSQEEIHSGSQLFSTPPLPSIESRIYQNQEKDMQLNFFGENRYHDDSINGVGTSENSKKSNSLIEVQTNNQRPSNFIKITNENDDHYCESNSISFKDSNNSSNISSINDQSQSNFDMNSDNKNFGIQKSFGLSSQLGNLSKIHEFEEGRQTIGTLESPE